MALNPLVANYRPEEKERGLLSMTHRGTRSPEAQARREQAKVARQYIIRFSFNDVLIHEQIDRTDPEDVINHLFDCFGYCEMSAVPCTFKGVVLVSDYGDGAFQK